MIHVGFTGTRYGMTPAQHLEVLTLLRSLGPFVLHHGLCEGADVQTHAIANSIRAHERPDIRIVGHPGPLGDPHQTMVLCDETRDRKPHMRRNADIVAESAVMVATPYEAAQQERGGTWRTIGMARKKGRPLAIVLPDGTVQRERWSW
jgi:hypothetical protein